MTRSAIARGLASLIVAAVCSFAASPALAKNVTVTLTQSDGTTVIPDFRWLLEEDNTAHVDPANPHDHANVLAIQFHKSHAPVYDAGCVGDAAQATDAYPACSPTPVITVPDDGFYQLSILPYDGRMMTGVQIEPGAGDVAVSLVAQGEPNINNPDKIDIPTSQIRVYVFEDNVLVNGGPDGGEPPLAGFSAFVEDAGGKYGASAGQLTTDAFGNPLGTTYLRDVNDDYIFDAAGDVQVDVLGTGVLLSGADGYITIRNLFPGKYGIKIIPPDDGVGWQQVTTIEGTPLNDTWQAAGSGVTLVEFGPPTPFHVFFGFVRQQGLDPAYATGAANVTGTVHVMHPQRPPNLGFDFGPRWDEFNGASNCWYALSDLNVLGDGVIFSQECGPDSSMDIAGLRAGSYQLTVWDRFLDGVFTLVSLTVNDAGECSGDGVTFGSCDLGQVGLFAWFARMDNYVYFDTNENGVRDPSETYNIPEQNVNLRFRDGSIFQAFPTDLGGFVPFDQVFPFFNWFVIEIDFGRFKATGVKIYNDEGGPVGAASNDPAGPYSDLLNPQQDPVTGEYFRVDTDSVLTQAYQTFAGTTTVMEWGKSNYANGESGGLSGVVFYGVTRAEDDPQFAAAEPWEPGIPRVPFFLYAACPHEGAVLASTDDMCEAVTDPETSDLVAGARLKVVDSAAGDYLTRALIEPDVDNYPFNFSNCVNGTEPSCAIGPEDIDRNGNGVFEPGDAIAFTWSDSFDDNLPTDCPASQLQIAAGTANGTQDPFIVHPGTPNEYNAGSCFDGLRPYNQVRPGLFDGGWAFEEYALGGAHGNGGTGNVPLVDGDYIVQMITPPAYEELRSQSKNVDFGSSLGNPAPALLPADCVGTKYEVPEFLELFPGVEANLWGSWLPSCNMKRLHLATGLSGGGENAAADFFLYTSTPRAARGVGTILNDLALTVDPANPAFGETYAPQFISVSFRDYAGTEVARTYSDEFGHYNALLPSTFTINAPSPSGVSPNMYDVCLNDPTLPDGTLDPHFQRSFAQICYTLQFMAGSTTYLDTPVIPVAAFANGLEFPVDCECENATPVIYSVDSAAGTGPVIRSGDAEALTIISMGDTEVANPAYDGTNALTVMRDFGFGGAAGEVYIGSVLQTDVTWSNDMISVNSLAASTPAAGDLRIVRGDNGAQTKQGVRISRGVATGDVHVVTALDSIQAVIDDPLTDAGDIIVVQPGEYQEAVILYKDVRIQGAGAGSTVINAQLLGQSGRAAWVNDVVTLEAATAIDVLPSQNLAGGDITLILPTETYPALAVFGSAASPDRSLTGVDGVTLTGGGTGGGLLVNAFVSNFEASNNIVMSNAGVYGGGVRIGAPDTGGMDPLNDNAFIHHNRIVANGAGTDSIFDAGGGVSIFSGSDNYLIASNDICGNFTQGNGGGISHVGLSDGGSIVDNTVRFNESFTQAITVHGGGLYVSSQSIELGPVASDGAGSLSIERNVFQGNNAGAGDGAAIAVDAFNGSDANPIDLVPTHELRIVNNTIVNNVTAGAGVVRLGDVANGFIAHNTIAFNDSTATAQTAFLGDPSASEPQVSGIYSLAHSEDLLTNLGALAGFSDPTLVNNILWRNRSCYWSAVLDPAAPVIDCSDGLGGEVYDELGVQGGVDCLSATYSIMSDPSEACDASTNSAADPDFFEEAFLTAPGVLGTLNTQLVSAATFDEGGNFVDVLFGIVSASQPIGELASKGDFHINVSSPARDFGDGTAGVTDDIDGDARPFDVAPDAGSDENTNPFTTNTLALTAAEITEVDGLLGARLWVTATSAYGVDANLTLSWAGAADPGVGASNIAMIYNASQGRWQRAIYIEDLGAFPIDVTVSGPEGSISAAVELPPGSEPTGNTLAITRSEITGVTASGAHLVVWTTSDYGSAADLTLAWESAADPGVGASNIAMAYNATQGRWQKALDIQDLGAFPIDLTVSGPEGMAVAAGIDLPPGSGPTGNTLTITAADITNADASGARLWVTATSDYGSAADLTLAWESAADPGVGVSGLPMTYNAALGRWQRAIMIEDLSAFSINVTISGPEGTALTVVDLPPDVGSTLAFQIAEVTQTTPQPRVLVTVTSAYYSGADLSLTWTSASAAGGTLPMAYNASKGRWQRAFLLSDLSVLPIEVTVSGPEGSIVTTVDLPPA